MKYLCVQPDSAYYVWQCQVLLLNFRKLGIEKDAILIFAVTDQESESLKRLKEKTSARIVTIEDTRKDKTYIPSIRPHCLHKFYKGNRWIEHEIVFYHDCDILFNKLPDWSVLDETKVSVSDTISYIGAEYIDSKGEGLLEEMCDVVGIHPDLVRSHQKQSGGAQYYFPKGIIDFQYWKKVERDSIALYKLMNETSSKYSPSHPIQSWCSDMWAVLWNIWLRRDKSFIRIIETEVHPQLQFSWPTDGLASFNRFNIYHNAGATIDRKDLFFKGDYINKSPFEADLSHVDKLFCSSEYVKAIQETKKAMLAGQI